jgi:CubicO group peptidase (beta-lactamase class C family)
VRGRAAVTPEEGKAVRDINDLDVKASVDGILNRWPAVGLIVGVIRDGHQPEFYRHGVADIASNSPMTEDTIIRVASITKTFTAVAVMQLWEQGFIDLDAPANDYLRAFRLIPSKPTWRPATVRQLLTHTAGLGEVASPWQALGGSRPSPGTTVAACGWRRSRAPASGTAIMGPPRSANSSRT